MRFQQHHHYPGRRLGQSYGWRAEKALQGHKSRWIRFQRLLGRRHDRERRHHSDSGHDRRQVELERRIRH